MSSLQDEGHLGGAGRRTVPHLALVGAKQDAPAQAQHDAPAQSLTPEQQALVVKHKDLVPEVARDVRRTHRIRAQTEELVSFGHAGLIEAAQAFEPGETPFPIFARFRIAGAIFDGLRREKRVFHLHAAVRIAATQWLTREHGTVDPVRPAPQESMTTLSGFVQRLATHAVLDIAARSAREEGEDDLAARQATAKAHAALREVLAELNDYDRALIEAVYFRGITFKQAAEAAKIGCAAYRRHQRTVLQRVAARLRARGITQAPAVIDFPGLHERPERRR